LVEQVEQAVALKAQRMAVAMQSRQQQQQQVGTVHSPGGLTRKSSLGYLPHGLGWQAKDGRYGRPVQHDGDQAQQQQQQEQQLQAGLSLKPIKIQRSHSSWDDPNTLTLPLYDSMGNSKSSSLHLGNSARLRHLEEAWLGEGVNELTGSSRGGEGAAANGSTLGKPSWWRDGASGGSNGCGSFAEVVGEVREPLGYGGMCDWGEVSSSLGTLTAEATDFGLGATEQAFLELLECGALGLSGKSLLHRHQTLGQKAEEAGAIGGEEQQCQQQQQHKEVQQRAAPTARQGSSAAFCEPQLREAEESTRDCVPEGSTRRIHLQGAEQQEQGGMSPPVQLDYSDSYLSGLEHDQSSKTAGALPAVPSASASPARSHTPDRDYDQNTKGKHQSPQLQREDLSHIPANKQNKTSPVAVSPQTQQQSRKGLIMRQKEQQPQQPGWVRPTARTPMSKPRNEQHQRQRAASRSAPGKLNDEVHSSATKSKAAAPVGLLSRENSEAVEQLRRQKLQEIRKGAARPAAKAQAAAAAHQPLQQPPFYPAGRSAAVPRRSNMGAHRVRGVLPSPPSAPGWRLSLGDQGAGGERDGGHFRSEYLQILHAGEEVRTSRGTSTIWPSLQTRTR
jgi:hypothetical protein